MNAFNRFWKFWMMCALLVAATACEPEFADGEGTGGGGESGSHVGDTCAQEGHAVDQLICHCGILVNLGDGSLQNACASGSTASVSTAAATSGNATVTSAAATTTASGGDGGSGDGGNGDGGSDAAGTSSSGGDGGAGDGGSTTATTSSTSSSSTSATTSSSSSSSASSTSSSSSSTSSTTTSSSSGGGEVTGLLEVRGLLPDQTQNYTHTFMDWIDPNIVQTGKVVTFNKTLSDDEPYTFNVLANGEYWCGSGLELTALVSIKWDGDFLPRNQNGSFNDSTGWWKLISNGGSGCNIQVHLRNITCPANDQDCDGYYANVSGDNRDCDDFDPAQRPGQTETWGDNENYDCDNGSATEPYPHVDPYAWKYTLAGMASNMYAVQLVDEDGGWVNNEPSVTYPMVWNSSSGRHQVSVGAPTAPTRYNVRYRASSNDAWSWSPARINGSCIVSPFTHQVFDTKSDTLIPFQTESTYCHFVKQ